MVRFVDLPRLCPECAKKFSEFRDPKRRMQTKATLIYWGSIVLTMVWMLALCALIFVSPVLPVPRNGAAWVLVGTVIFTPGVLLGGWALKMPKMVVLNCSACGWSESYILDR